MKFQVANITCQNCAHLIKSELEGEFGPIDIDVANKTLSVNLNESQKAAFIKALEELDYKVEKEL